MQPVCVMCNSTTVEKIPVVLVTGFLGSGKTTFLRHLAENHPWLQLLFLVNEFAESSIDEATLKRTGLPIESVALQALVSEPIKPCMDVVVMANTVHGYMSQSDKGEMVIGGGADGFNNYTQRGSFHHIEETVRALKETFPIIGRLKMLRQWGGIVDMTGDRSPIISKTPVENCFINCGWGTGGFKAIPGSGWAMAELIARGEPGPLAAEFGLDRFREGRFIDESVAAGVAH